MSDTANNTVVYPAHSGYSFTQTLHHDIYPATNPTKSDLSQPGKVVLISGAGRNIGRSTALRYAETGVSTIILCSRTSSQLIKVAQEIADINPSITTYTYTLDITNEEQVLEMAAKVKEDEGRLDILVNNAGMSNDWEFIIEGDTKWYLDTWDLHIKGTYLMLKCFLPLMVETAKTYDVGVDIINLATVAAHFVMPGASAYQASKLAVIRLTEFVVAEHGEDRVNCISLNPGSVKTGIMKTTPAIVTASQIDTSELCAGFVVWFTKEERRWLGGRYCSATWDVEELVAKKDEIVEGDKLKFRMVV